VRGADDGFWITGENLPHRDLCRRSPTCAFWGEVGNFDYGKKQVF
jgi:hypothetical protein